MSENESTKFSRLQWLLISAILLSAFIGIVISTLRYAGLNGSALVYIGIPTFIALVFAGSARSKSITGATLKAITFVILISGPILQEGFICMVMAAPIFYIVGALVAFPFERARKNKQDSSKLQLTVLPSLLLLMSMEGVFEETTFNRHNSIEHTQIINGSITDIKAKLASNRQLHTPDSFLMKLFPRPNRINASGLEVGNITSVDISYYKWIYWNEKRGKVQFEVVENKNNRIRFKNINDDSYLKSYMTWNDTIVYLQEISEHRTKVTWQINFERNIDPAWYAQPLQRYAVNAAAKMMVASLQ